MTTSLTILQPSLPSVRKFLAFGNYSFFFKANFVQMFDDIGFGDISDRQNQEDYLSYMEQGSINLKFKKNINY